MGGVLQGSIGRVVCGVVMDLQDGLNEWPLCSGGAGLEVS
jgi:hypothetical protein